MNLVTFDPTFQIAFFSPVYFVCLSSFHFLKTKHHRSTAPKTLSYLLKFVVLRLFLYLCLPFSIALILKEWTESEGRQTLPRPSIGSLITLNVDSLLHLATGGLALQYFLLCLRMKAPQSRQAAGYPGGQWCHCRLLIPLQYTRFCCHSMYEH